MLAAKAAELLKGKDGESIFTPELRAWAANVRKARLADAFSWLNMHFSNVREEEVSDRLAEQIETMLLFEDDCRVCTDVKQCPHSRATLDIYEEYDRSGFRTFTARARICDKSNEDTERKREDREFYESGIPPERRRDTFERFTAGNNVMLRAAKGVAVECMQNNKGLVIGGPVGCGKTHLAIAMGLKALEDKRTVQFFLVPELLEMLKDEMLEGKQDIYKQVKNCGLLILDDVGTSRGTDWKDERLFMLIDWRYSHARQTVITTNAGSEKAFKDLLQGERAERTFSRIMAMTEQVWMEGVPDYRRGRR